MCVPILRGNTAIIYAFVSVIYADKILRSGYSMVKKANIIIIFFFNIAHGMVNKIFQYKQV